MRVILFIVAAIGLSACAFGDETLTLSYDAEAAKAGLLSEASSTEVAMGDFEDARPDRKPVGKPKTADPKRPFLVGYKRNGYGQETGNILNDKPAVELVQESLETMLRTNGHIIGAGDAPVTLSAEVKEVWFDAKTGFFTIEFFGNVAADVTLTDNRTGEELFSDSFTGYYSSKAAGGLSGTWTTVMNAALADFARQVSLSAELKEALQKASESELAGSAPSS